MHILLCGLESSRKNLALDTTMYQIKASFKMMANAQKNNTEEFEVFADAAHAVTPALGQGANLAFEDGLELAIQLSSASDLRFLFHSRCGLIRRFPTCRIKKLAWPVIAFSWNPVF